MPEEPLFPRNTTGIGVVAILLTAVIGALGFLGQKALDLDERVIMLTEQQRDDEVIDMQVQKQKEQIANIENEQKNRLRVIDLVVRLDERMNRVEAHLTDLTKEVDRLRDAE
jgi:Tfp pilus assembly protein PilO